MKRQKRSLTPRNEYFDRLSRTIENLHARDTEAGEVAEKKEVGF